MHVTWRMGRGMRQSRPLHASAPHDICAYDCTITSEPRAPTPVRLLCNVNGDGSVCQAVKACRIKSTKTLSSPSIVLPAKSPPAAVSLWEPHRITRLANNWLPRAGSPTIRVGKRTRFMRRLPQRRILTGVAFYAFWHRVRNIRSSVHRAETSSVMRVKLRTWQGCTPNSHMMIKWHYYRQRTNNHVWQMRAMMMFALFAQHRVTFNHSH